MQSYPHVYGHNTFSVCARLRLFLVKSIIHHTHTHYREVRAEKERQRIIRTGRNKFNTKPKDVKFITTSVHSLNYLIIDCQSFFPFLVGSKRGQCRSMVGVIDVWFSFSVL